MACPEKTCGVYQDALESLRAKGQMRSLSVTDSGGKAASWNGKEMVNLASNDYLGIGRDRALREEFFRSLGGNVPSLAGMSSRLLAGNSPQYSALEGSLARAYGREAALVFNSGYHANTGMLAALAGEGDLVLSDRLVHASIVDGIRLSRAEHARFRHLDYNHLENLLAGKREKFRNAIIVTESLFSMDGDRADLRALAGIRERYGCLLYVDEAHSAGACGPDGLGLCAEAGLAGRADVLMGTFGKAYGGYGAFAVMDGLLRDYLVNTMRPFIFTTALPPLELEWIAFILEKMPAFEYRRARLDGLSSRFAEMIGAEGAASHIVPFMIGENDEAVRAATAMRDAGFLVFPIRPPTVPQGTARLRFSITADLDAADLERAARVLLELAIPGARGGRA